MGQRVREQSAAKFRKPMQVTKIVLYRTDGAFPVCPRCGSSMEREYQNFCDRCGQRLGWRDFDRAAVIKKL